MNFILKNRNFIFFKEYIQKISKNERISKEFRRSFKNKILKKISKLLLNPKNGCK